MTEARFALSFANLLGYGSALLVLVSFARNFVSFPILLVPLVAIGCALLAMALRKLRVTASLEKSPVRKLIISIAYLPEKLSFPKPIRSDIMPFIPVLFIALVELAYFQAFPIFPQFRSADFEQHVRIATDYSHGSVPEISNQVLYYGAEYLLSLGLLLGGIPMATIRYEMAMLVALSPLWFYLASLKLTGSHRVAWMTSLFYSLTGFVWFGMVFVSGLYVNFYGVLASLLLIVATKDFIARKVRAWSLVLLSLALVNAFLSHYTILLIVPPLVAFALARSRSERVFGRGLLASMMLLVPLGIGALLYQGLISTLFGFLGGGATFLGGTWLSQRIPLPSLSYMVAEVNNDWLTAFLLVPAFTIFVAMLARKPSSERLLLLGWFLVAIGAVPFALISWRFAFVALVPLILMVGPILSLPIQGIKLKFPKRLSDPLPLNAVGIMALMFFPVFIPSWSSTALVAPFADVQQADQQIADYEAMRWMSRNIPGIQGKMSLSVTDWRFIYSPLFGASEMAYAPDFRIIPTDPFSVASLAINQSASYVIVTKEMTIPRFPCNKPFDLTLSANATSVKVGDSVRFDMKSNAKVNASLTLIIEDFGEETGLMNGKAFVVVMFSEEGTYTVYAQLGTMVTYPIKVDVGSNPTPQFATVGVPERFCDPWFFFTPYSLKGSEIVYENEGAKVFRL